MEHEFRLPDVGEGLDQAEIVTWLVHPGDSVERDQPLVEILTDKSQTELPSPVAGVVSNLGFAEGDMAEVGQVLITLAVDGVAAAPVKDSDPADDAPSPRAKASPAVRKRALEAGLDLSRLAGTGPGGRITQGDLDAALAGPPPSTASSPARPSTARPAASETLVGQIAAGRHSLRGIRRVTAETMEQAWTVPHIHGADELDATNLLAGRARIKELHPERAAQLTPLSFFVMAAADALRRFPMMNASIDTDAGHIDVHDQVNIGIAVATDAGLIVPVIVDADRRDLFDLATEIARLSAAARAGSISSSDLQGGTFTISNYGSMGGRYATPIIRPPEAGIVGFGAIKPRPFVVDDTVLARPTLPIAMAGDHRLIDGDVLTAFQEHLITLLTNPVALLAT